MIGNQFYLDGRLYRFVYSGTGPPWPMQVWDDPTQSWQSIGIYGAQGPAGARALSGLLSLPPRNSGILDGNYLARADGLAILTASGDAIATQDVRVISIEEHILTENGAVIVV